MSCDSRGGSEFEGCPLLSSRLLSERSTRNATQHPHLAYRVCAQTSCLLNSAIDASAMRFSSCAPASVPLRTLTLFFTRSYEMSVCDFLRDGARDPMVVMLLSRRRLCSHEGCAEPTPFPLLFKRGEAMLTSTTVAFCGWRCRRLIERINIILFRMDILRPYKEIHRSYKHIPYKCNNQTYKCIASRRFDRAVKKQQEWCASRDEVVVTEFADRMRNRRSLPARFTCRKRVFSRTRLI
jgi:hypothetical protein